MNSKWLWGGLVIIMLVLPFLLLERHPKALPLELESKSPSAEAKHSVELESLVAGETGESDLAAVRESIGMPEPNSTLASVEPELSAPRTLLVRVTFADGQPVPDGVVLLSSDTEFLSWGTLDAAGEASIERLPGGLRVYAFGSTPRPAVGRLDDAHEEVEIVLPESFEFSGRVLVDGAPPLEPLTLNVTQPGARSSWISGMPPFPSEVIRKLWDKGNPGTTIIPVGLSSLFRTTGWVEGERVMVQTPPGYFFEADRAKLFQLDGPSAEVELHLTREAMLHGRVIEAESGAPVSGAFVELGFEGVSPWRATTDEKGLFSVEIPRIQKNRDGVKVLERVDEAIIKLWSANRRQSLDRTVRFDPVLGGDLGRFELRHSGELLLHVVDRDGAPVPKARVAAEGVPQLHKADSKGHVKLNGLAGEKHRFDVFSLNHKTSGLVLESLPSEPVTVVLDSCASLELRLRCTEGEPPSGYMVECVSRGRLLSADGGSVLSFFDGSLLARRMRLAGTFFAGGHTLAADGTTRTTRFSARAGKPIVLANVEPGLDFELRVIDSSGFVVWPTGGETHIVRMAQEERRSFDIEVPCATGSFRGRVEDAEGRPLSGITVQYAASKPRTFDPEHRARIRFGRTKSDEDGAFSIKGLAATTIDLYVRENDYAHVLKERVSLDTHPVLVLEPGRTIEVSARDPEGKAVRVQSAESFCGAFRIGECRRNEDGTYLCYDLPRGELTVQAQIGGCKYLHETNSDQTQCVFEVPQQGSIDVSWKLATAPEGDYFGVQIKTLEDKVVMSFNQQPTAESSSGSRTLDPASPGHYRAVFFEVDRRTSELTQRIGPVEFEIVAGESTAVRLFE